MWDEGRRPGRSGIDERLLAGSPDAGHRGDRSGRRLAGPPAARPGPTSSAWCATGCRRALVPQRPDRPRQGGPGRRARPGAAGAGPGRVRDRHGLPPGGADDRRDRQPQPGLDLRGEHPGDLDAARGLPPLSSGQAGGPGLVRQGLRRPGTPPLRRRDATPGDASLRRQQVVRGPDRPHIRGQLRLAGRDHALRQLLRRRRPELEPDRARDDPLGPPRPAAGDPLGRPLHPRLLLRGGRGKRLHGPGRGAGRAA